MTRYGQSLDLHVGREKLASCASSRNEREINPGGRERKKGYKTARTGTRKRDKKTVQATRAEEGVSGNREVEQCRTVYL